MRHTKWFYGLIIALMGTVLATPGQARIKLVTLPERDATVIRLDNPRATLVEEERVLALQKGINQIDFSWKGVAIDPDSIRLVARSHPDKIVLLNVSYPDLIPKNCTRLKESPLVGRIAPCEENGSVKNRSSGLLRKPRQGFPWQRLRASTG